TCALPILAPQPVAIPTLHVAQQVIQRFTAVLQWLRHVLIPLSANIAAKRLQAGAAADVWLRQPSCARRQAPAGGDLIGVLRSWQQIRAHATRIAYCCWQLACRSSRRLDHRLMQAPTPCF